MMITNYHARILSVGEIKANGEGAKFKKCFAVIETLPKFNEFNEEVYKSEPFEVEVPLGNGDKADKEWFELKALAQDRAPFPAVFNLRGFIYQEKGKDKHGKQLQLKRWTR